MAEQMDKEVHAVARTSGNGKTVVVRIVIAVVILIAAGVGYGIWKRAQEVDTTDHAQVDGQIYAISSRISGHVSEVLIEDNQVVKAGDVLARLDPKDYE